MTDQTVIKYSPTGHPQTGLVTWDPIPPQLIASGDPVQRGHQYFGTENDRVISGVWDCTEFAQVRCPYEVDEFMIVLDGSIIIEDAAGRRQVFRAGEAFILPKYTDCAWIQSEPALKYYFIHDNPNSKTPVDAESLSAIRIDTGAGLARVGDLDDAQFVGGIPDMGMNILYSDPSGKFSVGVWESGPMERVPGTLARSELMHILEGSGTIINGDGVEFRFNAGDTFLVPIGMGYRWHSEGYVKKIFCSYTP